MVLETIFIELSLIIIIAVAVSAVMRLLRQPLIIGYIITGILVGASFLNLVDSSETITIFSKIGITFLLFLVGLNLNPRVIKEVGAVSLITGVGQVLFTSIAGFFIARGLGFELIPALYISLAFTFSSTIIITKLLSDKRDLETLYGKISVGFLIVQDFIAIFVLMGISAFSENAVISEVLSTTLMIGLALIMGLFLIGMYVLPYITKKMAHSQELLLLFAIGWCFAVAAAFSYFNFSMEMGALLAGISLSLSPYRYEISSKMSPLRDFFVVLFFIWLGSQMVLGNVIDQIVPIIIFSVFILLGNPIIVLAIMGMMRYTKRNSFLAGLTVAQISEFSLILIALGVTIGHIPSEILSFATAVGLITIAGSTYFIKYNEKLYHILAQSLSIFERRNLREMPKSFRKNALRDYEIILFGYNRIGFNLLKSFNKSKKKFLVVDYNPTVITDLSARGIPAFYGDAHDTELLDRLNLDKVKLVVSTIPAKHVNLHILQKLSKHNVSFVPTSHSIKDSFDLYKAGAVYVIMPHFLGGAHIANLLSKHNYLPKKLKKEGQDHLKELKERSDEGHEHPNKDSHGR